MPDPLEKQKIALISDQQYPVEKADSEQVVNTVSALTSQGMDVKLVIPRNWGTFGVAREARFQRIKDFYGLQNGFQSKELIHLPLTKLRLEKYTHGIIAPVWAKLSGYHIVYTRNPLAASVAKWLGLKIVFETYRLYEKSRWLRKWLTRLAKSPRLLGIITHSLPSKNSLIAAGVEESKVAVIHNGFNPTLFEKEISKDEARSRLGLAKAEKIACYAGRLDREKGIDAILDLAKKTPEISYYLIGKCQKDPENWISQMASQMGLKNIKILSWMQVSELVIFLSAADVLIIPPTSSPMLTYGKTVLPIKLFLYLASGRPILAPALADIQDILTEQNAVLVEPDNLGATATAIRRIFSDADWAMKVAENAKADSRQHTWEARAKKIIGFINTQLSAHNLKV